MNNFDVRDPQKFIDSFNLPWKVKIVHSQGIQMYAIDDSKGEHLVCCKVYDDAMFICNAVNYFKKDDSWPRGLKGFEFWNLFKNKKQYE